jgi:O-antigen/teichoic acid export membrane protein
MKRNGILKNVALLGGAKVLSQGLILAASPLLTRIYSPEDFGVVAVFTVVMGLIGGFSCMKYEHALPLARDETEAANIVALCGLILSIFLFVVCVVFVAIGDGLAHWLKIPAMESYIWLIPVGVFGIGIAQIGRLWATRRKSFKRVAAADIAASTVVLVLQICLGVLRFGPAGLIFGRIGGIACSSVILLSPLVKDSRSLARKVNLQSLIGAAKKHHQFPLFATFSSGFHSLGRQMPIIFLSIFFGPAVTGLYALTRRTLNVPTMVISEQVRKVFYPYAAEITHMEELRHLTKTIFVRLVQIALPGTIILVVVAPALFALVFGERWQESGIYAQWLCPWLFLRFATSPLAQLPIVLKRQGSELVLQMVFLAARALALVAGGLAQDITLTIGLFAGVSLLCAVVYLIWTMRLIGIGLTEVVGVLGRELLIALPIVAPLLLAQFIYLGPEDRLWLLAVGAGSGLVAALVLVARTGGHRILQFGSGGS